MIPSLKQVTPHDDYTLSLLFDNGESGVLDLKPFLDLGVFQKIKNLDEFRRVRIAFDTLEWECGVDLDPEYIYGNCRNLTTISQSH
jgi:hypothetical protein